MGTSSPFLERKRWKMIADELKAEISLVAKEKKLQKFFFQNPFLTDLPLEERYVCEQILVLGQEKIFEGWNTAPEDFRSLLRILVEMDHFYEEIGGLIGYHVNVLQLLDEAKTGAVYQGKTLSPPSVDISVDSLEVRNMILAGISHLPEFAEFYPVGGAGDRLHLVHPLTGEDLPAAKFLFLGKNLLEILIDDLIAREYLYFKLFNRQVMTPLVLMTSEEKRNHAHVMEILEENHFFGRSKESFFFYKQPLVPTITEEGDWCVKEPLHLLLKPGGHGVIWKGAKEEKIFDKLKKLGRKKAIVRQINNPLFGVDCGLSAFGGYGVLENKLFGFVSCPREVYAAEGIIVLVENQGSFFLKNMEYCDFPKYGVVDVPKEEGSPYSSFSSNTNILFIDLEAIQKATEQMPFPGLLVNKKEIHCTRKDGSKVVETAVRLESLMQGISEAFSEKESSLQGAFVMSNVREKTISTVKKVYQPGRSYLETPQKCFYDVMKTALDLLENYCHMKVPCLPSLDDCMQKGFPFFFCYHPSLGPLYSIIQQKIVGGRLHEKSELQVHLSEVFLENVEVKGSLFLQAKRVCGITDASGLLQYSNEVGRICCKNVIIENEGVDWGKTSSPWSGELFRKESCSIILEGNGEFFAENVTLKGSTSFVVKHNEILRLEKTENGYTEIRVTKSTSNPSWYWKYGVGEDQKILLKRVYQ